MQPRAYRKPLILLLCALLVTFLFASTLLAAIHVEHNCMDSLCRVCAIIHSARTLLRQLAQVLLLALLGLLAAGTSLGRLGQRVRRNPVDTLITLKVRLNP